MIFPYCPDCPNSPKTANPCFISCYVYDKHNINIAVLIFFKTYVCKHEFKSERKHIELKPTQKNWPRVNLICILPKAYHFSCWWNINNAKNFLWQNFTMMYCYHVKMSKALKYSISKCPRRQNVSMQAKRYNCCNVKWRNIFFQNDRCRNKPKHRTT